MSSYKDYYNNQLSQITFNEYPNSIQLIDSHGNKTKYLDLNKESAEVLIKWLQDNYINNNSSDNNDDNVEINIKPTIF